jgi:hypothetical protein
VSLDADAWFESNCCAIVNGFRRIGVLWKQVVDLEAAGACSASDALPCNVQQHGETDASLAWLNIDALA